MHRSNGFPKPVGSRTLKENTMFTIRDLSVLKSGEKHQLFRSLFLVLSFLLIFMAGNFVRPATATPLYTCADITEISADQCQALQAFVTENPSADALATWFQTNTPCSWSGISCNLPNVVTSLNLSGYDNQTEKFFTQRLTVVPAKIGKLTQLTSLGLGSNELTRLPAERRPFCTSSPAS